MRWLFLLFLPIFPFGKTMAQNTYIVDFSNPKSVVNALFYAARTKNFSVLQNLCDPLDESDGDCRQICALPEWAQQTDDSEARNRVNEFVRAFESGHLEGEVKYSKTDYGELADVPFEFNQGNPNRNHETMHLVKRNGKWYLLGF